MALTLDEIRSRAESGDAKAQYQLGNVYQQGMYGESADLDAALRWYRSAAEQGHRDALFNIGLIGLRILPQQGDHSHTGEAVGALEKAVDRGDAEAMCLLGETLVRGDAGLATDPDRGLELLRRAADSGYVAALNRLGGFLMEGRHVPQDQAAANRYFKRAAEVRDPEGLYNLGLSCHGGIGMAVNLPTAFKLFKTAAELGHADAMVNYAAMLMDGSTGERDLASATDWIMAAARAGSAAGCYEAGQAFRLGRGVPENPVQAAACYEAAARQDHSEGLFSYGLCLQHGIGVSANLAAAEQCYQRAAMHGHGGAAHNLGLMFAQGVGVDQDLAMATELFEYAIACGEDDAQFSLGLCLAQQGRAEEAYLWGLLSVRHRPEGQGQRLVDHVGAELTEAQRQTAAQQAANWTRPNKTMLFYSRKGPA